MLKMVGLFVVKCVKTGGLLCIFMTSTLTAFLQQDLPGVRSDIRISPNGRRVAKVGQL